MKIPEIKVKVTIKDGIKKQIYSSNDAYDVLKELFSKDTIAWTEEVVLLALNKANEVYGFYRVSRGGMSATVVDPKVIYSILLGCSASAFILAHNHPSGKLIPSEEDKRLTTRLSEAGRLMDIQMLDHIIVSPEGKHLSMADEGML